MALRLITEGEFRSSRYGQVADQIEGRLTDIIASAEDYVEGLVNRRLAEETYTETVRKRTNTSLYLRQFPIQEVIGIDGRFSFSGLWEPLDIEHFSADENLGILSTDFYRLDGYSEIQVMYTAGYTEIPSAIKAAVILQTAYLAHQDFEIYGSGDSKKPGILYFQEDVERYLRPFKRPRMLG